MELMTYDETFDWIHQMEQSGIILGLERMEELLNRMGRPERALKIIHVAGTNGKGSVCTFISSILEAAGYKVGRYISPTLYDYRERIQINGSYIEKEALAEGMSRIRCCCEDMAADGLEMPTVFEAETALGFWYFKKKQCDYVVLETGMGGRLDSTNVIEHPALTVITSISMDHMAQLGHTLAAIAGEKAGILKTGTPAVFYPQKEDAMAVLVEECHKKQIDYAVADWTQLEIRERRLFDGERMRACQTFDYKTYKNMTIHLAGTYQIRNACLAIEAIEALKLDLDRATVRMGLERAEWPGRFQCISKKPMIFIDGAHNPEGAQSLRDSIETYFPDQEKILVMGVFKDKDYSEILNIMSGVSETLITFKPENPRGLDSNQLAERAKACFSDVLDGGDAKKAVELAVSKAGDDRVIIIFGSLSTISTICDILKS